VQERRDAVVKQLASGGELHQAAKAGDVERVHALLQANPRLVNSADANGLTPLHYAAFGGSKDVTRLLLANGALVNALSKLSVTPLHMAVTAGQQETAAVLLSKGANLAARDSDGRSPWAVAQAVEDAGMLQLMRPFFRPDASR